VQKGELSSRTGRSQILGIFLRGTGTGLGWGMIAFGMSIIFGAFQFALDWAGFLASGKQN
tara:strand:- start:2417 stop:2596 length:180 start_codon:yes stop_codon:yes gene_type:complete